jgi:hypothetical protein
VGERDNLRRKILYEVERVVRSVCTVFHMYTGYSGNNHVRTRVVVGTIVYIRTSSSGQGQVRTC